MKTPRFTVGGVTSGSTQKTRQGGMVWHVYDSAYCYLPVASFGVNLESSTPEQAARQLAARLNEEEKP